MPTAHVGLLMTCWKGTVILVSFGILSLRLVFYFWRGSFPCKVKSADSQLYGHTGVHARHLQAGSSCMVRICRLVIHIWGILCICRQTRLKHIWAETETVVACPREVMFREGWNRDERWEGLSEGFRSECRSDLLPLQPDLRGLLCSFLFCQYHLGMKLQACLAWPFAPSSSHSYPAAPAGASQRHLRHEMNHNEWIPQALERWQRIWKKDKEQSKTCFKSGHWNVTKRKKHWNPDIRFKFVAKDKKY